MDSVTHIVLGACIGEAIAGKQLGKRALFLGAFAQSVPDIDFITAFWQSESQHLVSHRGFTHSILFGIIATVVLTQFARWYFKKTVLHAWRWVMLFGLNIFIHVFIDSFNAYGTGWFEPFNKARISFHTIFVIDPLFSIGPLAACIALSFLKRNDDRIKRIWWQAGISLSSVYLLFTIINKLVIDSSVRETLNINHLSQSNYFTTPSPFNSILWYVVIKSDSGFYAGYHSVFDNNKEIDLTYFPKNEHLLLKVKNRNEVQDLIQFANEFYTIEEKKDSLIFNVLRFGQIVGWYDAKEKFVFHYYLDKPGANQLVTQRGRFERWNDTTIHSLWKNIKGN